MSGQESQASMKRRSRAETVVSQESLEQSNAVGPWVKNQSTGNLGGKSWWGGADFKRIQTIATVGLEQAAHMRFPLLGGQTDI